MRYLYKGYRHIGHFCFWPHWLFDRWSYYMGQYHYEGFRLFGHEWEEVIFWRAYMVKVRR